MFNGCPCKDCTNRNIGCHGKCNEYKDWKNNVQSMKDSFQVKKDTCYAIAEHRIRIQEKLRRRSL